MRRKYFFFDYDGTLAVPRTQTIIPSTLEALRLLRAGGHFVALATGRMQCNAVDYTSSLGFENIVADGGFSVTVDRELKWLQPLDLDMAKRCLHGLEEQGVIWAVQLENELVRYTPYRDFEERSSEYYVPVEVDENLDIDAMEQILKIYIPADKALTEKLVESGVLDGVPWVVYNSENIFVEPMDKQLGIRKMMEILGAPVEDVVVFGDGKNDLSMFMPEWTSIAMGNALPELKAAADYITDDCDKDGVYNACKHFGWI